MVTSGRASSDGLAVVALGAFDDPDAPTSLDARCARLSLRWPGDHPLCCAQGADIDGRARLQIVARLALEWSGGPRQDDAAPSGIVERLADVGWQPSTGLFCCGALDVRVPNGSVAGEGCRIRAAARAAGEREDAWLLPGCALFPLDLQHGALVPSLRIPEDALVAVTTGTRSLWDDARARVALRFGELFAAAVDEGVANLQAHRAHGLHLKTLK